MKFALVSSLLTALAYTPKPTSAHLVLGIHGSGTTNPSKCYWNVMDMIEEQTKVPTRLTYRAVGSSTGIEEFIGNTTVPDNDFGSGDIPISSDTFFDLEQAGVEVVHLPILLGTISFFHSVDIGAGQATQVGCLRLGQDFQSGDYRLERSRNQGSKPRFGIGNSVPHSCGPSCPRIVIDSQYYQILEFCVPCKLAYNQGWCRNYLADRYCEL
jgi:hypothetical protein